MHPMFDVSLFCAGIPTEAFNLVLRGGKSLKDKLSLQEHDISDGATLEVMLRVLGGMDPAGAPPPPPAGAPPPPPPPPPAGAAGLAGQPSAQIQTSPNPFLPIRKFKEGD